MDTLTNIVQSITPQQWYLLGGLVVAGAGAVGITEWVKRHHFKVKAEELWSGFVVFNVIFWSTILTAVDAVMNNLGQLTHIGSLIPTIAPFAASYGPALGATVLIVHSIAIQIYKFWQDRKDNKPLSQKSIETIEKAAKDIPEPVPLTTNTWSN